MKTYLVEIRLKDWIHTNGSRTIAYEEVEAVDSYYSLHAGLQQFKEKIKYSPIVRRKFETLNIGLSDICAPDCVEI